MILSNLQHFHFQMENRFPLTTQKSETTQNQLLMFSSLSASALPPFPWLIHWDQLPKFLAQLKWQVSSHYEERNSITEEFTCWRLPLPSRAEPTAEVLYHTHPSVSSPCQCQCWSPTLLWGRDTHWASISCHGHLTPTHPRQIQAKPQDLQSSETHLVCVKQLWEVNSFSLIKDVYICLEENMTKKK